MYLLSRWHSQQWEESAYSTKFNLICTPSSDSAHNQRHESRGQPKASRALTISTFFFTRAKKMCSVAQQLPDHLGHEEDNKHLATYPVILVEGWYPPPTAILWGRTNAGRTDATDTPIGCAPVSLHSVDRYLCTEPESTHVRSPVFTFVVSYPPLQLMRSE